MGAALGPHPEQLDRSAADRAGSWSKRASAPSERHVGERKADDQEHGRKLHEQEQHQQLAAQRLVPAEEQAARPSRSDCGTNANKAGTSSIASTA
jgi:hypothetical protein